MTSLSFDTASETKIHTQITRPSSGNITNPLLVFIHYWGGTSRTWKKVLAASSPCLVSTHPTLSLDLRGWGSSKGPVRENEQDYSVISLAEDVISVLHQIEQSSNADLLSHGLILIGHSMGAKVALATLGLVGNKEREQMKGLVLVAPAPPSSLALPEDMKEQQKAAYQSKESVKWTVENILSSTDLVTSEDIGTAIEDSLSGNALAKAAWPSYGMAEDVSNLVQEFAKSQAARTVPVQIIVGEHDIVEPKERVAAEVGDKLSKFGVFETNLTVVANAKHLIPLENPESIVKAILAI